MNIPFGNRLLRKLGACSQRHFIMLANQVQKCILNVVLYYVYIMTNPHNKVIYTGMTRDLIRRVHEHRNKLVADFTKRYNVVKLVYYEAFSDPHSAIAREKALKGSSRSRKIKLIESLNPEWKDLWEGITMV